MKSLNDGSQLPDISRPRVPHQAFDGLWVELKGWGAVNPAKFFVEPQDETCDLISSLSEGRDFDTNDIQAVQKIFAERTRCDGVFKAPVGRTQDSDVDFYRL